MNITEIINSIEKDKREITRGYNMVTQKEKFECPVCGEMISKQGIAGHNKSKKHLDALAKQQELQQTQNLEVQETKPAPSITKTEIKNEPEIKQTKIESVKTTKPKQEKQEIQQEKEYDGLEW